MQYVVPQGLGHTAGMNSRPLTFANGCVRKGTFGTSSVLKTSISAVAGWTDCPHQDNCKYVHNPECYWNKKGNKRNLGEKCLFLHSGGRATAAEEGADAGGDGPPNAPKAPAQPRVKAKAKAKAGKKTTQAAMIQSAEDV